MLGAAETQEPGAGLAPEGGQPLQVLGGEAPVADDLEGADAVRLPLAHPHDEGRLAGCVVDEQRVAQHLEVHVATVPVEFRQALLQIGAQLLVVVVAGAEPPEALRPRLQVGRELGLGEMAVPLEAHLRDRHAPPFVHVEDHPYPRGIGFVHLHHLDLGEVVALGAVQGVDAAAAAGHGGGIDGPRFDELDLVPDAVLREATHAAHRPFDEDRALAQAEDEERLALGGVLGHAHVVVLTRGVERLDGVLHVAIPEGFAGGEAALGQHLVAVQPPQPEDDDGIGRDGLPLRARGAREEHDGSQREDEGKPADHALEPESARNPRRSLSGATSTSTSSPRANSPTRIFSDSGSSTYFWIARFSGRAPKCSS